MAASAGQIEPLYYKERIMKKIMVCGVAKGSWKTSVVLRILGLVVALPLLASGCGSSSIMTKTERITKPQQGQALVNFVRPSFFGGAITFGIWDGNNLVGVLTSGKCIQYQTTPGEHYFLARAENWSCIKADLAPDKHYVIKANIFPGVWKGRVALDPVTEADYKNGQTKDVTKWLTTLEPTMPDPLQRESYVQPRLVEVTEAKSRFQSGRGWYKILGQQDCLPQ